MARTGQPSFGARHVALDHSACCRDCRGRNRRWSGRSLRPPRGVSCRRAIAGGLAAAALQVQDDRFLGRAGYLSPALCAPVYAYQTPDVLFTPNYAAGPYIPPLFGAPLLPVYYEPAYPYDYQGAYYYGGPYVGYWDRLPYACGVYGYC